LTHTSIVSVTVFEYICRIISIYLAVQQMKIKNLPCIYF